MGDCLGEGSSASMDNWLKAASGVPVAPPLLVYWMPMVGPYLFVCPRFPVSSAPQAGGVPDDSESSGYMLPLVRLGYHALLPASPACVGCSPQGFLWVDTLGSIVVAQWMVCPSHACWVRWTVVVVLPGLPCPY